MIRNLEEEIYSCEAAMQSLEEELCKPDVFSDHEKALEITNQIACLKEKLEQLYIEWENIQST
jgi:ATP-binding cassette subfamily F protein 3